MRIKKRTKETKVPSVNYSLGIDFSCKVIECRKAAPNVCNAKDSAMCRVKYFRLRVDLESRKRRVRWSRGCRRWSRSGLHVVDNNGDGARLSQ